MKIDLIFMLHLCDLKFSISIMLTKLEVGFRSLKWLVTSSCIDDDGMCQHIFTGQV